MALINAKKIMKNIENILAEGWHVGGKQQQAKHHLMSVGNISCFPPPEGTNNRFLPINLFYKYITSFCSCVAAEKDPVEAGLDLDDDII